MWVLGFVRRGLCYWMSRAKSLQHRKAVRRQVEACDEITDALAFPCPAIYVDLEAVAEGIDVLKASSRSEQGDALLLEGSKYLINRQLKDGSWPVEFAEGKKSDKRLGMYDLLHPTWVAVQALRDRVPARAEEWEAHVRKSLDRSGFRTPAFPMTW